MDIIAWVTEGAQSLPLALVYSIGGVFALLESGLGLGFFIPGETVVMLLSATFDQPWKAVALFGFVTIGASAGDHVGYLLGRRFGGSLRETRLITRLGQANWDRAVAVLEKRGAWAVFLTRMVPVVRTLTPAAAGVAKVRYPAFLPASLAGAATWSALYVIVGYLARSSLDAVEKYLGNAGWILVGAAVAVAAVIVVVRTVRKRRRPSNDPVAALGVGADLVLPDRDAARRIQSLRTTLGERFHGHEGAIALFTLRAAVIAAATLCAATDHFVVAGILLLATLLSKPIQARLRPRRASADPSAPWAVRRRRSREFWTEPTLDRVAASLLGIGFAIGGVLPWQGLTLLLLPEILLGLATALSFRGLVRLPVTRAERARSAFQLVGLTAVAFGFAGRITLPVVVAPVTLIVVGYLLLLVGIVFSYVVAAQYSRAMLARWQETLAGR